MMTLGLNPTERTAYEAALRSTHTRRVEVEVTDLNGLVLSALDPVLLDGQVVVDLDAETTRSASLSFLDPKHTLNFDTTSPDDGALFVDRMLRIRYGVQVEALGRYVWAVIFYGPVTKLDRASDVINIEAQGMEALASTPIWRPLTLKKNMVITKAIELVMAERAGESNFSLPPALTSAGTPFSLPAARSLDRMSSPWEVAKSLASATNRQLYYTAEGVLTLRPWPKNPVYTFTDGDRGDVVTDVSISYVLDDVRNTIEVTGTPSGKKQVRAVATAPPTHVLAPARLGRNGVPRYLAEVFEDVPVRSAADARAKAEKILDDRLQEVVEVQFDSLPIPHLEVGDQVSIRTEAFATSFKLARFSIPLGSGSMPVGYMRKTALDKKRIRR